MGEESAQDKTEEASARQRQDFRKRGEVAKSQELASAFMLAAGAVALLIVSIQGANHFFPMFAGTLGGLDRREQLATIPLEYLKDIISVGGATLAGAFTLLTVTAILSHMVQIGPLFTLESMKFRPERLNPFSGLKRLFMSKEAAANLIKTIAKVAVIGGVAALAALMVGSQVTLLLGKSPADLARYLVRIAAYPLAAAAITMVIIGIAHLIWQRHSMNEKMKMTKEDAKRDMKESEGDPLIRGHRQQRHRQALDMNRLITVVPEADVIINNPTHVSVALRYRPDEGAPIVVAKGVDFKALKIREIATQHDVPMVENPPLARALQRHVDVGNPIPEKFFRAVAEVLAYVMRQQGSLPGDGQQRGNEMSRTR